MLTAALRLLQTKDSKLGFFLARGGDSGALRRPRGSLANGADYMTLKKDPQPLFVLPPFFFWNVEPIALKWSPGGSGTQW